MFYHLNDARMSMKIRSSDRMLPYFAFFRLKPVRPATLVGKIASDLAIERSFAATFGEPHKTPAKRLLSFMGF